MQYTICQFAILWQL